MTKLIKSQNDWEERRLMTEFLYKKGWQLTREELWCVIREYDLEKEWEQYVDDKEG